MNRQSTPSRLWLGTFAAATVLATPSLGQAQQSMESSQVTSLSVPKILYACYVPGTGTVYRIKEPGTPSQCGKTGQTQHVEFSWTDGSDGGTGIPGPAGPQGEKGEKGEKGDKGDPGDGGVSAHGQLSGLEADDHEQYLLTDGVRQSRGFAVTGQFGVGQLPVTSGGPRLVWHPAKAAFRAGLVVQDQWDDVNIGKNSVALGFSALASGDHSFAFNRASATAEGAFAVGVDAEASGGGAIALGPRATAIGTNSFSASLGTARGVGATALWNGEAIANHTLAWLGRASNQYSLALGLAAAASGENSVAVGWGAKAAGENSVAIGRLANANGERSIALGFTEAGGENSVAIGNRVTTGLRTGAIIIGDNSVTSGNFAFSSRDNQFAVRAQHFWLGSTNHVFSNDGRFLETSTGAFLSNGGTWTNSSDANRKHLFQLVDGEDVLQKLAALPITTWTYRDEDAEVRHMGPTAQDFRAAFGLGDTDKAIATVDADGVAFAAIQALASRTGELRRENLELRKEIGRMLEEHHEMGERLARLEELLYGRTSDR